ncbi:MAG: PAS domain S-box protein [Verrucomicrobia bacterium]|nr:PAS domain S-box protein [Verrucomicrobiota bacterium]
MNLFEMALTEKRSIKAAGVSFCMCRTWWIHLLLACGFLFCADAAPADGSGSGNADTIETRLQGREVITNARAVRELTVDQADRGNAVRLKGVVTFSAADRSYFFLQDQTSGIYVNSGTNRFDLEPGTELELEGIAYSGRYAPSIKNPAIRSFRPGAMPAPVKTGISQLLTGRFDSQWIETTGVIRSVWERDGAVLLTIADSGFRTSVRVAGVANKSAVSNLVDAAVVIRGVSSTRFNEKGRLEEFQVLAPSLASISMERAATRDPFGIPVRSIGHLLRFTPPESDGHRIRIDGIVTLHRAGELLFVSDSTNSVCVRTSDSGLVQPGDRVEIVGFPEMGECAPELRDGSFRRVGDGPAPSPVSISAQAAFSRANHAHLIETEGLLIDRTIRPSEQVLVLQSEGYTFPAILENTKMEDAWEALNAGSTVRVTGICIVELNEDREPQAMQILLRSPDDVVIFRKAPWWTLRHTLMAVGGAVCVALAGVVWGFLLRRKVDQQAVLIRQRLEREVTLEQRYQELFENANDIVYTTDLEGNFTSINEAGQRVLGYSRSELLNLNSLDLLPVDHLEIAREMTRRKLATGGETTYKIEILAKDHRKVAMELSTRLIYRFGKPFEVHGIARDLTERMQAEEALLQSERNLRTIVEDSPIGIATIDPEYRLLSVNRAFCEMMGYDREELVGRAFSDFLFPEDRATRIDPMDGLFNGTTPVLRTEQKLVGDAGEVFWVHLTAVLVRKQEGSALVGLAMMENISARKKAEASLQQSEMRFRKAFRASPVSVAVSTLADGRIVDVNDAFLSLFGFARDEVVGRYAVELGIWPDAEQRAEVIRKLQQRKSLRNVECRLLTKLRKKLQALVSVEVIDFDGEPCSLILTHDLTDRVRLEALLRQSQKMEAAGQLAAGLAHDFNNIMTIIQVHTSLLLSSPETHEKARTSLGKVLEASERAAKLTRQLMAFCRKQVIERRFLNLNGVIENVGEMLGDILGKQIAVSHQLAPDLPSISADVSMMEQVLVNLAINARDAMPAGGLLSIRTSCLQMESPLARRRSQTVLGTFVCLEVSDTGCGMSGETLSRVYEPFFTTKDVGKGTGLGLSVVYSIIKQHDGWIEAESEIGAGTAFKIYLPGYIEKPEESPDPEDCESILPVGTETILVVEDEESLRHLASYLLRRQGYRVIEASSGKEALNAWTDQEEKIDLVFTDIVMPGGMSGINLVENLLAKDPGVRILFTSGYYQDLEEESQRFKTSVSFIPKPYQPVKLATTVRNCLDAIGPAKESY